MMRDQPPIPFNRPFATGQEHGLITEAILAAHLSADGRFTESARRWLEGRTGTDAALLVHSATGALELAAMVAGIGPGDEVIMPSYTFVSTANAVALRGATPVFVDIRPDTLNIDEALVEDAVGPATKAVVAVHYAGVACAIERLQAITARSGALLIEDAAQGVMASFSGKALGTFGALGALSFHETKNVTCGEGGALLVNDPELVRTAEIVRQKGTDRIDMLEGRAGYYTWLETGSSFALSELAAAFLWAQLQSADEITARRMAVWEAYHRAFAGMEQDGLLQRPVIPPGASHNAHMYRVVVRTREIRDKLIEDLGRVGIQAVFHYVPLHDSPGGRRYGRSHGELAVTSDIAGRLVRLPLWVGMDEAHVERIALAVSRALGHSRSHRLAGVAGRDLKAAETGAATPEAPAA
jgi:dTDP-4-amino-4,6-dideoxygalactose transaminase